MMVQTATVAEGRKESDKVEVIVTSDHIATIPFLDNLNLFWFSAKN